MKVIAKEIDVIACFNRNGEIQPIKIRLEDEENEERVIKIKSILKRDKEKLAGNIMQVFVCTAIINGMEKIIELKYEISSNKWIIFKV